MSGGFFRGTSADQDTRFSNKQAKLLKTQKFAPELEHLVDITKVKMDVIKPWIAKRVTEFLEGFEDEVLINFIYTLLEGKEVNGKKIQIQLTGFMEKNTGKFMKELWALLLSAQKNASGVPQQFLDAKEEETRKKMVETDRIFNEIQRREEKEVRESQQEKERQMDDGTGNNRAEDSNGRRERGSGVQSGDEKGADARNGFRGRSSEKSLSRSISVSPGAKKRSVSPQGRRRPPRRSITPIRQSSRESMSPRRRSFSRRSPSPLRRRARSPVRRRSPSPFRRRSPSPARRSPSPSRRRSRSPVRRWSRSRSPAKRRSRSPVRHRSPPRRRRSPSPWRRRSPSPGRHRSPPPSRRSRRSTSSPRSRSPVKSRSPSPFRRRFYSPARRSSYVARRRSPSPAYRHRSPYPARRRSPSPTRRRSPSPAKRRSPSPGRRKTSYPARSPARHRSPSPRSRRSLSPVDRRSLSPIQERSPVPGRRRISTPTPSRSPSPASQLSGSPLRHSSASPVKMTSPRLQKSLNGSPRERNRNLEPAAIMSRRQPISLSPQRDHSIRRESNRKVPPVAASPEKSPLVVSPEVRNQNFDKDRRLASLENRVGEKLVLNGSQSPSRSRDRRVRRVSPETTVERQQSDRKYEDKKLEERKSGRSSVVKQRESPDHPTSEEASLKEVHHLKKSPHRVSLTGDRPDTYTGDFSKFDEKRNSQAKDVGNNMSESLVKSHKKRRSSAYSDSESEGSDKHTGKRKRRRSKRKEVTSDDTSSESEIEDRKEAKRKKKEERKARKEERRRRREERRRKREEKRASKRKPKLNDADALSSDPENVDKDVNTSNGGRRKKYSSEEETESQKKRLEIELREKALESLRAKKGISH